VHKRPFGGLLQDLEGAFPLLGHHAAIAHYVPAELRRRETRDLGIRTL